MRKDILYVALGIAVLGLVVMGYTLLTVITDKEASGSSKDEHVSEDFKEDTLVTINDIENELSDVESYIERWEDDYSELSDRERSIYFYIAGMIDSYKEDRERYDLSKSTVLNYLDPNYVR